MSTYSGSMSTFTTSMSTYASSMSIRPDTYTIPLQKDTQQLKNNPQFPKLSIL